MVQPFRNSSPVLTVGQPLSSVCPLLVKQGADFILYSTLLNSSSSPLCLWIQVSYSRVLRVSSPEFLPLIKYSTATLLHKITGKLFVLTKDRLYLHSATPPFVHKKETGGAGGDSGNETKDVIWFCAFSVFLLQTGKTSACLTGCSMCSSCHAAEEGGGVCPVKHKMNLY